MAKRRAPTWSRRHKQWLRYVEAWIGVFECGEKIPLGPEEWRAKVETLAALFDRFCPDVVFAPHAEDWNSTHGGTHYLAVDALGLHLERSARGPVPLILTEFWHELGQPNLMVGLRPEIVATELMATAEHGGEVRRNPYHLRHPARLMNNVRRGSEVVGGQGGPAHRFPFAELYRVA